MIKMSSAAIVIGALRVQSFLPHNISNFSTSKDQKKLPA